MHDIPFALPKSLASYVLQFEDNPNKTVSRLKKQLQKRGPDPVGYFLLAWFHYRNGLKEESLAVALQAKNYAPGSPFFDKLPYFFAHPKLFDAWQPSVEDRAEGNRPFNSFDGLVGDLNTLIEKLSEIEVNKIKHTFNKAKKGSPSTAADMDDVDDIVSETLAKIHSMQQNFQEAITIYQKLIVRNPEKKQHYKKRIGELQKKLSESE